MKVTLVYNQKSGKAQRLAELRELFGKYNIEIEKAIPLDEAFKRRLKHAVDTGATIATIGGDGTISAVAELVAHTKATLAPLPGGTLNHFTKDLGIPQDLDEAVKRLMKAKVYTLDAASVNNRIFINNSSLGLYPSTLQVRTKLEEKIGKWPAAVIASFQALLRFRTDRIEIEGETVRTPFIFVGNNEYAIDSVGIATRKRLDRGELSLFVAHTVARMTLLKVALLSLAGKSSELREFDVRKVTEVTIKPRRSSLHVSRDGEVVRMQAPLHYKVHPGALKVLY
jgi:diacylglycerol kinase family enzyme